MNSHMDDAEDHDEDIGLDEEGFDEESFDDFGSEGQTLGDLWRDNPVVKIGVIAIAVILVFGLIFIFSGSEDPTAPSFVSPGADVKAPPGTEEASPAYVAAVEEESEARIEQAFREGESALPTPIEPPVGRLEAPAGEEEAEDPLQRWRRLQEERLQRELQQTETFETDQEFDDGAANEATEALAGVMSQQMQAILESKSQPVTLQSRAITSPDFLEQLQQKKEAQQLSSGGPGTGQTPSENILVPAGEILYSQLLTEANSDVPGPVLAQILTGPLKGSRILGSFEVQSDRYLTLTFNTVVIDGVSQGIDGIALDPATTLPGMATEVDYRLFRRVVLPMAASFVEGAAEAIAESGRTTITIEGDVVAEETEDADNEQEIASGVEEAGRELRQILDEMAGDTEVLVKIDAGTPFGLLILQPIVENPQQQQNTGTALDFPEAVSNFPAAGIDENLLTEQN